MAASDEQQRTNPFGDVSLFQQFDETNIHSKLDNRAKAQVIDNEKLLADLKKENEELRRRLRLLEPPREGKFTSAEDSPVVQVIFMHHDNISNKRQQLEDLVQNLITSNDGARTSCSPYEQLLPQRSALRIKGTNVTFLATGSVQYYDMFCLDILGRPLIDGDISMTDDWTIPIFQRGFPDPLPIDENVSKKGRVARKKTCFNCGDEGHGLADCPVEKDFARINAKKQEFRNLSSPGLNSKRYHKDTDGDQKFAELKPGVVSDELRKAMGLREQEIPSYIYTMRMLGYPPGYLLEAEITSSGLAVYDKLRDEEGELKEAHDQPLKYNSMKLIKYPGFNVTLSDGFIDDCQYRNMPPMQEYHSYDIFQSFMASKSSSEGESKKRKGEFSESEERRNRKKGRIQEVKEMDIGSPVSPSSSDAESRGVGLDEDDSQKSPFRPPLPPSPAVFEQPPLPVSTPPETPKRTPTHTPRGTPVGSMENTPVPSPSVCSTDGIYPEKNSQSRVSPSLEDLVSQQEELMTKLEGDYTSTSSDTDTGALEGKEIEINDTAEREAVDRENIDDDYIIVDEASQDIGCQEMDNDDDGGEMTEDGAGSMVDKDEDRGIASEMTEDGRGSMVDRGHTLTEEEQEQEISTSEVSEENGKIVTDTLPNKSGVPHRKNFAEGITPHVDENVSSSKGVFKKILGLLKTSKD